MRFKTLVDSNFLKLAYDSYKKETRPDGNISEVRILSSLIQFLQSSCILVINRGHLLQLRHIVKKNPYIRKIIDPNCLNAKLKVIEKDFQFTMPSKSSHLFLDDDIYMNQIFLILKEKLSNEDKKIIEHFKIIALNFDEFKKNWPFLEKSHNEKVKQNQNISYRCFLNNFCTFSSEALLLDPYLCSGKASAPFKNLIDIIRCFTTQDSKPLIFHFITAYQNATEPNIDNAIKKFEKEILSFVSKTFENLFLNVKVLKKYSNPRLHDRHLLTKYFHIEIPAGFDFIYNGKSRHNTNIKITSIFADFEAHENIRKFSKNILNKID